MLQILCRIKLPLKYVRTYESNSIEYRPLLRLHLSKKKGEAQHSKTQYIGARCRFLHRRGSEYRRNGNIP